MSTIVAPTVAADQTSDRWPFRRATQMGTVMAKRSDRTSQMTRSWRVRAQGLRGAVGEVAPAAAVEGRRCCSRWGSVRVELDKVDSAGMIEGGQ